MRLVHAMFVVGALVAPASAHVSISSGPAAANKSQLITFSVGHGCEDANGKALDTIKVRVAIPAGVTSVRAVWSEFGKPSVVKSGDTVTHVEWTKPVTDLLAGDEAYYELEIRARIPDAPFTKLKFDVQQTCQDSTTQQQVVVNWDQPEGSTTGEPAAFLRVVPAWTRGWNKVTVPQALTTDDLPVYLGDTQIVWSGTSAYTPNQHTAAQISSTPGVTPLTSIAAGTEIWVKY